MERRYLKLGAVRAIPKGAEESREIPFIISTGMRDRHNTVANTDNWKLDNFRKNPVVGYMHLPLGDLLQSNDPDYVIGHDLNPHVEGKGRSGILAGILKFDPAEINLMAEKCFRKVLFGSLRAASATFFEIGKGNFGQGNESKGSENETYYFKGQELIEWSLVNIPSNPGAGKRGVNIRSHGVAALAYVLKALGKQYTISQIENMYVGDVLALLQGRDIDLKTRDIAKVKRLISDPAAQAEQDQIITMQQIKLKTMLLN